MAKWHEQFRKDDKRRFDGTYKGVPFRIDSHSYDSGRRIVDHLFPYSDDPFTEDLGRKQRMFSVELYVLGDDYFKARDDLMKALESEGSGILVHPYLGTKTVECESFTLSENKSDGGIAKFSVKFHETTRVSKAPPTDSIGAVSKAGYLARLQSILDMARASVEGLSEFSLNRYVEQINQAVDSVQAVANAFPGNLGVAELGVAIRSMKQTVRNLIRTPMKLAESVVEGFDFLLASIGLQGLNPLEDDRPDAKARNVTDGRVQRAAFEAAINFPNTLPPVVGTTPSRVQERENQRLLGQLIKVNAITQLSEVSVRTTYATFEEAIKQRDVITGHINSVMDDPGTSDEMYAALSDLKSAVVAGLPIEGTEDERLSYITINETVPSLVLTYELYGSLSLEQDLIARNRVQNPAFLPFGKIEVVAGG